MIWRSEEELVTISDCGLDVYTVVPARKIVKVREATTISFFSGPDTKTGEGVKAFPLKTPVLFYFPKRN